MKHSLVNDLLEAVRSASADISERRDALKNLSLLVEKNSQNPDRALVYRELLPPELLGIELNESQKSEIADSLCRQLELEPAEGGVIKEVLWSLGKTDREQCLAVLQSITQFLLQRSLDEKEVWEGLLSIEDLTYSVDDAELAPLLPRLEELRKRVLSSGDEDSHKAIESLFEKLRGRNLSAS